MQSSMHEVIKPMHERLHVCPHCYARLSYIQRFQRSHGGEVKCRGCGRTIKKDRNIVY